MLTVGIALIAGALINAALLGRARRRGSHRPRALELVIEPPRPVCCATCCPSGIFRGTMPHGYATGCRCTGRCGHPVRDRGQPFPCPNPWDEPIDMPTPGPGVRRC